MVQPKPLRVAALVDLPRGDGAGGHVKYWERIAKVAAQSALPLDLTVYFSGKGADEVLAPHVRLRHLPPVFSTARLTFLPYVPDHTDLAPWHPALARELGTYDAVHTTDGYFAFAQTAARVCAKQGIPLVTSFHTDTPAYARIFTRQTLQTLTGFLPPLSHFLMDQLRLPEKQEAKMLAKLKRHLGVCAYTLTTRPEDKAMAEAVLPAARVRHLRLGVDRTVFGTHRADGVALRQRYGIADNHVTVLFVGRVDVGKNIGTLVDAVAAQIADGAPLHLIVAGVGPMQEMVREKLGAHATLAGYVPPDDLAYLYASVDVFALPSEVEIGSMAVVEALVSGCPVLASAKSGVAEIFSGTPALHVVESGALAWGDALKELALDKEKRLSMSVAAANYADRFIPSWDQVLAEDFYETWCVASRKIIPAQARIPLGQP